MSRCHKGYNQDCNQCKKDLEVIAAQWEDKDNPMFQEKTEVFDFMYDNFDTLLCLARKQP